MLRVRLLRYTTYHCGSVQRAIISFLREQGYIVYCDSRIKLKEKMGVLVVKDASFWDALKGLERRGILSINSVLAINHFVQNIIY